MEKIYTIEQALALKNAGALLGSVDMTDDVYHDPRLGAIGHSGLLKFRQSPEHYKAWLAEPRKETPALKFGKMLHMAILQPDIFEDHYISTAELGALNLHTKADKARLADFEAEHAEKIIVEPGEWEQCQRMRASVMAHPFMSNLLKEGIAEQSFFWIDEETGVLCKIRVDFLNPALAAALDLKSTKDASDFYKSCGDYAYHIQAAFYLDALRRLLDLRAQMVFITVEKTVPYGKRLVNIAREDIDTGRVNYRRFLNKYAECLQADYWPGYPYEISTVKLSSRALKKWGANEKNSKNRRRCLQDVV